MANITTYKVDPFDAIRAAEGALCVCVSSTFNGESINSGNTNFKGSGICVRHNNGSYVFSLDGQQRIYTAQGKASTPNAVGTKLMLGEIVNLNTSNRGDRITRSDDTGSESKVTVNNLNARDEFAIHILGKLLKNVADPSKLSTNEMAYYSKLSYTWAQYMMGEAANAREGATTSTDTVQNLSSNTEKLLNNISVGISNLTDAVGSGSSGSSTTTTEGTTQIVDDSDPKNVLGTTTHNFWVNSRVTSGAGSAAGYPFYVGISRGCGATSSEPLYISGGAFPSRAAISSSVHYGDSTHGTPYALTHFLTFNNTGAIGYAAVSEVKKAIVDSDMVNSIKSSLITGILSELQTSYSNVQEMVNDLWDNILKDAVEDRIKALVAQYRVKIGNTVHTDYTLVIPE